MRSLSFLLLLSILACSDSSGPQGKDPTVQIVNTFTEGSITLVWWDQSGQQATFVAAPGQTVCAQFTATTLADSVRFLAFVGDTTGAQGSGTWFKTWSPWFDPVSGLPTAPSSEYPYGAEYWTLTTVDANGTSHYPGVFMRAVENPPC